MSQIDIVLLICERMDEMEDNGRKVGRIVIGNREAMELEDALECFDRRQDIVNLTDPATLFDVRLKRVDLPSFLGVVAEGFEDIEA